MAVLQQFEKNIAFCLTTTIFRKIKNATGYHSGTSAAIWSWWSHSETFFSPKRCWVDLHKVWKRSKLVFIVRPVGVSNLGGVVKDKKDPTWWHRSHRRRCHRCRRQSRGKARPMSNLLMAYRPMLELQTMLIRRPFEMNWFMLFASILSKINNDQHFQTLWYEIGINIRLKDSLFVLCNGSTLKGTQKQAAARTRPTKNGSSQNERCFALARLPSYRPKCF